MITEHLQGTFHVHHSHKCLYFIAQVVHYIAYQTGGAQEVFCHECSHVNGKLESDEWSIFYWVCTTIGTMGATGNNNDACSLESWFLWNYFSANQSLKTLKKIKAWKRKATKKGKIKKPQKNVGSNCWLLLQLFQHELFYSIMSIANIKYPSASRNHDLP